MVCAPQFWPISSELHCVKLRAFDAFALIETSPRYVLFDRPAEMPFEMIRDFVFLPRWIIFGTAVDLLASVGHCDRVELARRVIAAQDAGSDISR